MTFFFKPRDVLGTYLIYFIAILIIFVTLYLPRYAHEYDVRQMYREKENLEFIFTLWNEPDTFLYSSQVKVDRFQIQIPLQTDLIMGESYRVAGRVETEAQSIKSDQMRLKSQSISVIEKERDSGLYPVRLFRLWIAQKRQDIIQQSYKIFPPSEADLILGIILGKRLAAQSPLETEVRELGLSHITVASGANLILFTAISSALIKSFLGLKKSVILTIILIFAYIMMVGLEPSILRAACFSILICLSALTGRQSTSQFSFFLVCIIMLIYQPFIIYSLSFLLSLGATAGLIFILPFMKDATPFPQEAGGMWKTLCTFFQESIQTTIAAQIFTVPLLLTIFSKLSVLSIVSNIFAGFFSQLIMAVGFLYVTSIIVGLGACSVILSIPLWISSSIFIGLIHLFSSFPLTTVEVSSPSPMGLFVYCLLWGGVVGTKLALQSKQR